MAIKPVWIVTNQKNEPLTKEGVIREFKSERSALAAVADALTQNPDDEEAWVWKLSHVGTRPTMKPVIDEVGSRTR
jgi:hypothetical protein